MKNALILEGGAMRGMYTAGVLDVFMEQGIDLQMVVGVSAGVTFGINYKARHIGRTIRHNMKYCNDPRYGSVRSLLKTGDIYEAKFCYDELPKTLDPFDEETYRNYPVDFYAVCTDALTGQPVYKLIENGDEKDILWIRASASMPFVSKAVEIDGGKYLDGGITDSIPIFFCKKQGCDKYFAILTRMEGYRKPKIKHMWLLRWLVRKYPEVIKAMKARHILYNQSLDELEKLKGEGKAYIMRPSRFVKVSKTESDPNKLKALYDLGREDALNQLEAIREFLK